MKIRQFLLLAPVIVAGFCALAHRLEVPVAPIGVIATAGVLLLALQLEEGKWGNRVSAVFGVFKNTDEHHA